MQNITSKPALAQAIKPIFSFNLLGIDKLFSGFSLGDFAVIYGSSSSVTSLLCVRAQLPLQLGGLGSNVVFIDGGITFRLYNIARLAQLHQLNPESALKKIFISRAFTAYQLASLIMDKLEETIKVYNAKVAIISDIAGFFLDSNIASEEAQRIYSQIMSYLSNFAQTHQIVLIATYPVHSNNKRNDALQEITNMQATTILRFTKKPFDREVALEKHPHYMLGVAKLPSQNRTLTDFTGVTSG